MKNLKLVLVTFLVISGFSFRGLADEAEVPDLLGVIGKEDLEKAPYAQWYRKNNDEYVVDHDALSGIGELLNGVEIKVVMGTWCHDSKREVPRFYKIISSMQGLENNTQMIGLDRQKQAPDGEIDGMGITNTPTFIFYREGQEINRIVETPVESLEKDMIKILNGKAYRHSKMP